ncbi:hypothetical protein [Halorarius litoreus]|uniref:hypothetical protein n=1 Tax=Halorarius litoreus TaxID=2962676 RepID=UPI0020CC2E3B|nr:hypothetical protein [Halorarius litoreus]
MSAGIDTVRTDEPTDRATTEQNAPDEDSPDRKALEVSDLPPERVTAYARATADEGHPELYFERKGGRTYLVAR